MSDSAKYSISSLLDSDPESECGQQHNFSQLKPYTGFTQTEPTTEPILDLSRPLTAQRYHHVTPSTQLSGEMEGLEVSPAQDVPMEIPATAGDFTQLGIEFEIIPEVGAQSGGSEDAGNMGEWDNVDSKFDPSKVGLAQNSADFRCSQLEIPFSQLEMLADSASRCMFAISNFHTSTQLCD